MFACPRSLGAEGRCISPLRNRLHAIAPFGFANGNLPIIMAKDIADLSPDWFWLGGGSVDLKLGFKVSEFVQKLNPFIVDIYK